jgi:hypothetical protein
MNKGGKWVFGWSVVDSDGEVQIPPEAFVEYGFWDGEPILYLRGSRRSGGFSVGRPEKISQADTPLLNRSIGEGIIQEGGRVVVPAEFNFQPGRRLLCVRGSGYSVLFAAFGPIYEGAASRTNIASFRID